MAEGLSKPFYHRGRAEARNGTPRPVRAGCSRVLLCNGYQGYLYMALMVVQLLSSTGEYAVPSTSSTYCEPQG